MFSLEFWIVLTFACILGELLSVNFFLLSVGVGAGFAALTNHLKYDPATQLIIFVITTIICILLSRPLAKKLTKESPSKKSNADRLIGEEAIVIKKIVPDEMGTVKILGDTWRAISNEKIAIGEKVTVEKIDGVKLVVKKK
ncbi:MAG: NfeD family protein [Methanobrevibacter sp.]|jgi:membrane protein implicated in regulation of membrane protease activity|nr:NfeD family protein [Candidatus Methanovirga basalitermitum]